MVGGRRQDFQGQEPVEKGAPVSKVGGKGTMAHAAAGSPPQTTWTPARALVTLQMVKT